MPSLCVVNLDDTTTIRLADALNYITSMSGAKMQAVADSVFFALALEPSV